MIEFELRSIDEHLLRHPQDTPPDGALTSFTSTGLLDATPAPDLFIGDNEVTAQAQEMFRDSARRASGFPIGDCTFEDVYLADHGLIIDRANRVVWRGTALGWAVQSIRRSVEEHLAGDVVSDDTLLLDERLFEKSKAQLAAELDRTWPGGWHRDPDFDSPPLWFDHLHLLGMPGFTIYGHWLIDVLPRIARIGAGEVPAGAQLIGGRTSSWAAALSHRLGVDINDRHTAPLGSIVHVGRVDVQTLIKRHRVLDRARAQGLWTALMGSLARDATSEDLAAVNDKVYVARSTWRRGRTLTNNLEVEEFMRGRGFSVIHPEDYSLVAQQRMFSRARRVVGEDGSGLHNVIYARPGLHLTVINLHRINLFHSSIANVKQQHLTHLQADPDEGGWRMSIERLAAHLDL